MSAASLDIAKSAAERGWRVIPVELTDDGRKLPVLEDWPNVATTDQGKIRQWFGSTNYAVGLVTGKRSDLYIVDIDKVDAFEQSGIDLVNARFVKTRREGGRHAYYSAPLDGKEVRNVAASGLDFRGDGGFVVCWGNPNQIGTLSPLPSEVAAWARGNRRTSAVGVPENGELITEGNRETRLASLAGSVRRAGASENEILAVLRETNARCVPPLADEDLQRIAQSISRYDASAVPRGIVLLRKLFPRQDQAVPETDRDWTQNDFAMQAADELRSRVGWRADRSEWWLASQTTNPGIWTPERERGAHKLIKNVVLRVKPESSASYVDGVIRFAKDEMSVNPSAFDLHPWMLGVCGGVVDLHTGDLLPPDPELHLTRCAPVGYVPDAKAPHWYEHVNRLLEGDSERINWFQRAVGAALVGNAVQKDQIFVYVLGESGNGKGTLMRALLNTLGQDQHAASINPRDLTMSSSGRHLAWMHRMKGVRLALVEEMVRSSINVALLKTLTGADVIVANRMRQDDESWVPTHTLFMTSNHAPNFAGDSVGMQRRYRPLLTGPSLRPDEMSSDWEQYLREEAPGILAWAIEGCLLWQQDGKRLPLLDSMHETIDDHIVDDDPHSDWFSECISIDASAFTTRKQVMSSINWWRARHELDNLHTHNEHRDVFSYLVEQGCTAKRVQGDRGFGCTVKAG